MSYDSIFFSPHLDDAVLSCGGQIINLVENKKKVLVVTCFTKANNPKHLSSDAIKFLKDSSGKRQESILAERLFLNRKKEDKKVAKILGFDYIHLNFVDALFRFSKTKQTYPSFKKIFSGTMSAEDHLLQKKLAQVILNKINKLQGAQTKFYFPLGIGKHIDHIIVFKISKKIKELFQNKTYHWHDIPYKNHLESTEKRYAELNIKLQKNKFVFLSKKACNKKKKALDLYSSQITGLKKSGLGSIDFHKEQVLEL